MTNESIETRLKRLENLLGLGTGRSLESLSADIAEATSLANRALQQQETGNVVYGGPLRTQNSGNAHTSGPYVRDVDATFFAEFDVVVPVAVIALKSVVIRIKPGPIRSSVVVTAGGSSTPSGGAGTSAVTGIGTLINVSGQDHQHRWALYRSNEAGVPGWPLRIYDAYLASVPSPAATEGVEFYAENAVDLFTSPASPVLESVANHDHTHATPDHTHPSHTHPLTLGIAEGGSATGLHLYIDGVDVTAALGGPWNATTSVDITTYLLDSGKPRRPVTGVHTIKITSTAVGSIEAWIDWLTIISPVKT